MSQISALSQLVENPTASIPAPPFKKVEVLATRQGPATLLGLTEDGKQLIAMLQVQGLDGGAEWTPILVGIHDGPNNFRYVDFAVYQDPVTLAVTLAMQVGDSQGETTLSDWIADPSDPELWRNIIKTMRMLRVYNPGYPTGITNVQCLTVVHHPVNPPRETIIVAGTLANGSVAIGRFWGGIKGDFDGARHAEFAAPGGSDGVLPWRAIVPAWLPQTGFFVLAQNALRLAIIPPDGGNYVLQTCVNTGAAALTCIASAQPTSSDEIGPLYASGDGIYRWSGAELSSTSPPKTLASLPKDPDARARISVCGPNPSLANDHYLYAVTSAGGGLHVGRDAGVGADLVLEPPIFSGYGVSCATIAYRSDANAAGLYSLAVARGGNVSLEFLERDANADANLRPWMKRRVMFPAPQSGPLSSRADYSTRIAVLDDNLAPMPLQDILLTANASGLVRLNGAETWLRRGQPTTVQTAVDGSIMLVHPATGLGSSSFTAALPDGAASTSFVPAVGVFGKVADLRTVEDIWFAKDCNGQPVFPSYPEGAPYAINLLDILFGRAPPTSKRALHIDRNGANHRLIEDAEVDKMFGTPDQWIVVTTPSLLNSMEEVFGDLITGVLPGMNNMPYLVSLVIDESGKSATYATPWIYTQPEILFVANMGIANLLKLSEAQRAAWFGWAPDWDDLFGYHAAMKNLITVSLKSFAESTTAGQTIAEAKQVYDNYVANPPPSTPFMDELLKSPSNVMPNAIAIPAATVLDGPSNHWLGSLLNNNMPSLSTAMPQVPEVLVNLFNSQASNVEAIAGVLTRPDNKFYADIPAGASIQTLVDDVLKSGLESDWEAGIDALAVNLAMAKSQSLGWASEILQTPVYLPVVSDLYRAYYGPSASTTVLDVMLLPAIQQLRGTMNETFGAQFDLDPTLLQKIANAKTMDEVIQLFEPLRKGKGVGVDPLLGQFLLLSSIVVLLAGILRFTGGVFLNMQRRPFVAGMAHPYHLALAAATCNYLAVFLGSVLWAIRGHLVDLGPAAVAQGQQIWSELLWHPIASFYPAYVNWNNDLFNSLSFKQRQALGVAGLVYGAYFSISQIVASALLSPESAPDGWDPKTWNAHEWASAINGIFAGLAIMVGGALTYPNLVEHNRRFWMGVQFSFIFLRSIGLECMAAAQFVVYGENDKSDARGGKVRSAALT